MDSSPPFCQQPPGHGPVPPVVSSALRVVTARFAGYPSTDDTSPGRADQLARAAPVGLPSATDTKSWFGANETRSAHRQLSPPPVGWQKSWSAALLRCPSVVE